MCSPIFLERRQAGCTTISLHLYYLIFLYCQLPLCELPKHNCISLQVWLANVLYFCSFCKPTFSGATREWDALYKMLCTVTVKPKCLLTENVFSKSTSYRIVVTDRLAKCVDTAIFEISLENKVTHSLKDRELNQLFVHDTYAFLLILSSFMFSVYTRCLCFFVIYFF
jgi:hypothetical protein